MIVVGGQDVFNRGLSNDDGDSSENVTINIKTDEFAFFFKRRCDYPNSI